MSRRDGWSWLCTQGDTLPTRPAKRSSLLFGRSIRVTSGVPVSSPHLPEATSPVPDFRLNVRAPSGVLAVADDLAPNDRAVLALDVEYVRMRIIIRGPEERLGQREQLAGLRRYIPM